MRAKNSLKVILVLSPQTYQLALQQTGFRSRQAATYWGLLAGLLCIAAQSLFQGGIFGLTGRGALNGHAAFFTTIWWNLFFLMGAGQGHQTNEDRREVWPLLILSDIGFTGLWLESVVPALIAGALTIAVQLPYWAFVHSLGGLEWGEIMAAAALLATYMVLATSIMFLVSLLVRKAKSMAQLTMLLLALLVGTPWLIPKALAMLPASAVIGTSLSTLQNACQIANGWTIAGGIENLSLRTAAESSFQIVAIPMAVNLAWALLITRIAYWAFGRLHGFPESNAAGTSEPLAYRFGKLVSRTSGIKLRSSSSDSLSSRPRAWAAPHALEWKSYQYITFGNWGWKLRCWVYGLTSLALVTAGMLTIGAQQPSGVALGIAIVAGQILLGGWIVETCYVLTAVLNQELTDKTAGSLMLLPLTPRELITRLFRGAALGIVPPWGFGLASAAILGITVLFNIALNNIPMSGDFWSGAALFALGAAAAVAQLVALAVVCTALSLELKQRFAAVPLAYFAQYVITAIQVGIMIGGANLGGFNTDHTVFILLAELVLAISGAAQTVAVSRWLVRRFEKKAADS